MKRRALLVALGAGATAGCAGVLGREPPLRLRAMRARGDETDVTCRLSDRLVEEHPALADVLARASETPVGEWATTGISEETGGAIVSDLESRCETPGGLYRYDGQWYFISVTFTDSEDAAAHHGADGHDDHNHSH